MMIIMMIAVVIPSIDRYHAECVINSFSWFVVFFFFGLRTSAYLLERRPLNYLQMPRNTLPKKKKNNKNFIIY